MTRFVVKRRADRRHWRRGTVFIGIEDNVVRAGDLAIRLAPQQTRIVLFVAMASSKGGGVTVNDLIDLVYADAEDGGPLAAMHVIRRQLWVIRQKLEAIGVSMPCSTGARYSMAQQEARAA